MRPERVWRKLEAGLDVPHLESRSRGSSARGESDAGPEATEESAQAEAMKHSWECWLARVRAAAKRQIGVSNLPRVYKYTSRALPSTWVKYYCITWILLGTTKGNSVDVFVLHAHVVRPTASRALLPARREPCCRPHDLAQFDEGGDELEPKPEPEAAGGNGAGRGRCRISYS